MTLVLPSVMLVIDRQLYRSRDEQAPLSLVEEAIEGGITMLQFRPRSDDGDSLEVFAVAQRLRELTRNRVTFIVTDDLDLAEKSNADGVLLTGEHTYRPSEARRFLRHSEGLVGCFAATVRNAAKAERGGADFVQVGPVFSARQPDLPEVDGVSLLRKVKDSIHLPVIAFGGVASSEEAVLSIRAGADGVAVTQAILEASDPRAAARSLRSGVAAAA